MFNEVVFFAESEGYPGGPHPQRTDPHQELQTAVRQNQHRPDQRRHGE